MIKNLVPSLPEVGKIKIGFKGKEITSKNEKKFQPPQKLDHFIVTSLERGPDGNFIKNEEIHKLIGDRPKELNVRLIYDDPDLNFLTRYVCYDGTKLWCSGNGECASRLTGNNGERVQVKCPCERLEPGYTGRGKCKPSGVLSVMLDQSPIVGGVWKLRTTSYNSVTNILSSMAMISRITGGVLAGIPLKLTFGKKTTTIPNTEKQTTIPVIGLIYKGSVLQLAESGQKTALQLASYRKRIEYIEDIARAQIDKEIGNGIYTEGETDTDIAAEFFPEEVAAGGPATQAGEEKQQAKSFEDLINESIKDSNVLVYVDKYLAASVKAGEGRYTEEQIKQAALEEPEKFLEAFHNWVAEQKESAAPANNKNNQPGEEPVGKKGPEGSNDQRQRGASEERDSGNAGAATAPSQGWDPYTADFMKVYRKDKVDILLAEIEKKGISFKEPATPREMHKALKKAGADNAGEARRDDSKRESVKGPADEKYAQEKATRATCIEDLRRISEIDRGIWMKAKQCAGLLSQPNLETMDLETLVKWAATARQLLDEKNSGTPPIKF